MSEQNTGANITLQINEDDFDDGVQYYSYTFTLEVEGNIAEVSLQDISMIKLDQWIAFENAVNNNEESILTFCQSNGEVTLSTKDGKTTFIVSKYGDSGDGIMKLIARNGLIRHAVHELVQHLKKI
jgi:hypothetical protein